MKIIYGIQSDGLGHYGRSKAIVDHLIENKHDVLILTSDRVYNFLKKNYKTIQIERANLVYKNNRVDYPQTLFKTFIRFNKLYKDGYKKTRKIMNKFKPDIVISDFEFFTIKVANELNIPLLGINNNQALIYTDVSDHISNKFNKFKLEQDIGIRLISTPTDYSLITSFFDVKVTKKNVQIINPIIRKEIIDIARNIEEINKSEIKENKKKSKDLRHILVYQTSKTNKNLIPALKKIKSEKFIVYGFEVSKKINNNIILKKNSTINFIKDLASSKGIITNGGFGLISEAIFLHKPILSNPIEGQYEQIINATFVRKLGYGMFVEKINDKDIKKFIKNLKKYEKKLLNYKQKDNSYSFKKIDEIINKLTKDNRDKKNKSKRTTKIKSKIQKLKNKVKKN